MLMIWPVGEKLKIVDRIRDREQLVHDSRNTRHTARAPSTEQCQSPPCCQGDPILTEYGRSLAKSSVFIESCRYSKGGWL
ncbi:unnamed protein product [Nezara viridula]|uniref:Uncharacterized protein n=1 Tax=Nezara viridula TaxID=85310 RepID=A0A9P0H1P2_NEZVI|nr:unnamed protein product [Nezara viridula]